MDIFSTKDVKTNGVKVLVYGESGLGKTTLCATAPRPIILSAESGLLSLRHVNLPYIKIDNIDDLTEACDWAYNNPQAQQFDTICLDSLTEIAEVVLANAKTQVKDVRQAYGELLDKMMNTVRAFRDLPGKHVYMTAQQMLFKDESTGIVKNLPAMPGSKLGPKLPYHFDEVFQMCIGKTNTGEQYRYLKTQPDFNSVAKDRSGRLDPMEQPHLGNIFAKILQG